MGPEADVAVLSQPASVDESERSMSPKTTPQVDSRRDLGNAPLHLVLNAGSGRDNANDLVTLLADALLASGRDHTLHVVQRGESIEDAARRQADRAAGDGGVLVAVGGDGTVNAVANAAVPRRVPMGVVPQGTFNYFGRTHGLPVDPGDALDAILRNPARPVQVGRLNGRVFLVNASVGLYPQLLEDREAWKKRFGRSRLVALAAGIATVFSAHRALRLAWVQDGVLVHERTLTLFVGNNRLQIEQLGLPEAPMVENGSLAIVALRPTPTLSMLGLMIKGSMGRLADTEYVRTFAARQLDVRTAGALQGRRRMKVATDGEVLRMNMPLHFDVSPQPLWLIKPDPPPAERPS